MKKLNKAEIEVLIAHGRDMSAKEIAVKRFRSIKTVETQSKSIRTKMGCHSMTASFARAIKLGYIDIDNL